MFPIKFCSLPGSCRKFRIWKNCIAFPRGRIYESCALPRGRMCESCTLPRGRMYESCALPRGRMYESCALPRGRMYESCALPRGRMYEPCAKCALPRGRMCEYWPATVRFNVVVSVLVLPALGLNRLLGFGFSSSALGSAVGLSSTLVPATAH